MHAGQGRNDRREGSHDDFAHNNYVADIDP